MVVTRMNFACRMNSPFFATSDDILTFAG